MSPLKWFQQDLCPPGVWISVLISSSPIAAPLSAALYQLNLHAGRKQSLTSSNATQIQWRMCLISRYRSSPDLNITAQQHDYMHPQPSCQYILPHTQHVWICCCFICNIRAVTIPLLLHITYCCIGCNEPADTQHTCSRGGQGGKGK